MVKSKVGMRSRDKSSSPLLRSFAAVALVIWVSAVALCTAHCTGFLAEGHGEGAQPSCHVGDHQKATHHDDGDSENPEHCPSSTLGCAALQSASMNGKATTLVQPPTHVLYLLAPVALVLDATPDDTTTLVFRQAPLRDWVFTPEVSLGPAFRSLAPPLA